MTRKFALLYSLVCFAFVNSIASSQSLKLHITETDISKFPIVYLKIEISRNGNLLKNLTEADFTLFENGISQQVESINCPGDSITRFSIALLLDRSGSMTQTWDRKHDIDSMKIRSAKKAISTFIDLLEPRDEAAIYSFSSDSRWPQPYAEAFHVDQPFTNDKAALKASLVPIAAVGGTWLWQSMMRSLDSLELRVGKKVLIVLTDGRSSNEPFKYNSQAVINLARQYKIPIYIIGLGTDVDASTLTNVANSTGGRFILSPDESKLETVFADLANDIITDACVLKYISTNSCFDGTLRKVDLIVGGQGVFAEDSTSFIISSNLTPISLVAGTDIQVSSKSQFTVPVFIKEFITTLVPLTYKFTAVFDPQFLIFEGISTTATISSNGNVLSTVLSPGRVEISLANHLPFFDTGDLVHLLFSSVGVRSDTLIRIQIENASLTQYCPTTITTFGSTITLLPCSNQFALGSAETIVIDPKQDVFLPIRLRPGLAAGTPYRLNYRILYDESLLKYLSLENTGTLTAGSGLFVVDSVGSISISCQGITFDSVDAVVMLRFSPARPNVVTKTSIQIANLSFETDCLTTTSWEMPVLLINGVCQRVVGRPIVRQTIRNSPNPFNPTTDITFAVPKNGIVQVHVFNAFGNLVQTLVDGWMEAGEYTIAFVGNDLPAGTYFAVSRIGDSVITHPMLLVK